MNDMKIGVKFKQGDALGSVTEHNAAVDVEWVEIDGVRIPGDVVGVSIPASSAFEHVTERTWVDADGIERRETHTTRQKGNGQLGNGIHTAAVEFILGSLTTVDARTGEAPA